MRFHVTEGFAAAQAAWEAAYAVIDGIDEDGPVADAATKVEYDAIDAVLLYPATTPTEVAQKLAFMRQRGIDDGWGEYDRYATQIDRDLTELQRPCVSPAMSEHFAEYVGYRLAGNDADKRHNEAEAEIAHHAAGSLLLAIMHSPCFTPGDFLLKTYVDMLGKTGGTEVRDKRGFTFEIDIAESADSYGDGVHDIAFAKSVVRDLLDCDLGRCLMALGRVDFDAEAWLDAASRARMTSNVVIQQDGSRGLWIGEARGELTHLDRQRAECCQALLAGGFKLLSRERHRSVIEYVQTKRPELVIDCRAIEAIAA